MAPTPPDHSRSLADALNAPIPSPPPPQDTPGIVRFNVNLNLSGVRLQSKVPVPSGPLSLRQFLPVINAFTEAIVQAGTQGALAQGKTVSCKLGCAHCCRQLVPLAPAEAHMLANLVDALPEPRRSEIHARFVALKQKLAEANLLEQLTNSSITGDDHLIIGAAYYHQHLDCPFLDDERCSIYSQRPTACREYLVTSDPLHCANIAPEIESLKLPGSVSRALSLTTDTPAQTQPPRSIPLPLALEWATANPEPPPTTNGPQLLNQFLAHLSRNPERAIPT